MDAKLNLISQALSAATIHTPVSSTSPLITQPDKYAGEPTQCKEFLLQCSLYFSSQERLSEQQKIEQFISLLTGKALTRATAIWFQGGDQLVSYNHFVELFQSVFDHSPEGKKIREQLLTMSQGSRGVAEYALKFHNFATGSSWNEHALKAAFCQGLNPEILTGHCNGLL